MGGRAPAQDLIGNQQLEEEAGGASDTSSLDDDGCEVIGLAEKLFSYSPTKQEHKRHPPSDCNTPNATFKVASDVQLQ